MPVVPRLDPARWPLPLAVRASIGLHALGAGVVATMPASFPWVLATLLANHAILSVAGLVPRSHVLGPNITRLPPASAARGEIAITIDDGPDPDVTPDVLDLLERHGAVATFFCIAGRAAEHPALTREIVARGHSVQNHSAAHRHTFSLLGPRGYADELSRAQRTLSDIVGVAPTCFRAPAGLRNPFLDPVLNRLGLHLVSWSRRGYDTQQADAARVLARLGNGLAAGDILLMHDGHAARDATGRPVLLDVIPALLARIEHAKLETVTLPQVIAPRHLFSAVASVAASAVPPDIGLKAP